MKSGVDQGYAESLRCLTLSELFSEEDSYRGVRSREDRYLAVRSEIYDRHTESERARILWANGSRARRNAEARAHRQAHRRYRLMPSEWTVR